MERTLVQTIAKNLRRIIAESGKSPAEVARGLGIGKSTLSHWMNAERIPKNIDMLCEYLHVSRADLVEEHTQDKPLGFKIPVLGVVAAGIPLEAITDIRDYEEISPEMLRGDSEYYALEIKGDSMEPRITNGDRVIFRVQDDAESGDIVIAMVNGYDATCKKLRKYSHGIDLVSLNQKYEPMYFSNEEIKTKPVKIIGKVVELRARF